MRKKDRIELECPSCGILFYRLESTIKNRKSVYCSRGCANRGMEDHEVRNCVICGKEFKCYRKNHHCCSKKCMGVNQIGHNRRLRTGREKRCSLCEKPVYVSKSSEKEQNFCSKMCQIKFYVPSRTGAGNPMFVDGDIIHKGYAYKYAGRSGRELRHRVIAEKVLGRRLRNNEVVHHIDGNKLNNKNNNLLICTRSYHTMLHWRAFNKEARLADKR